LSEGMLDKQMLALLDKMRIQDDKVRDWFARVLRERTRCNQESSQEHLTELNRQLTLLRRQQDQLLNLRLLEEIDQDTFAAKGTELRDRIAKLTIEVDAQDRGRAEQGEIAVKAFELSQTLKEKWFTADYRAKRRMLEIVCLNFKLVDVTLVPEWRKPFDVLAEGLVSEKSRAERIRTFDLYVPNAVKHYILSPENESKYFTRNNLRYSSYYTTGSINRPK